MQKFNQSLLIFSNKLEALFTFLRQNLFGDGASPFARRLIIVPSQAMEEWVRKNLAEQLGISTGISILFLNKAISRIINEIYGEDTFSFPNQWELALRLEDEMRQAAVSSERLWKPLHEYLEGSERRFLALVKHLSTLFHRYGVYGMACKDAWEKNPDDWQKLLWKRIFTGPVSWDCPASRLPALGKIQYSPYELSIHLFSFSHLPKLFVHFFSQLGNHFPVNFYQLSPCREFWSDLVPEPNSGMPLLSNLGKVGRRQAALFEESGMESVEAYIQPAGNSQLHLLQKQMLNLTREEAIRGDDSIQIHIAPSRHREVEIIFHLILSLMEGADRKPSDFLVMAPDINLYTSSIASTFGSELPFRIMDLPSWEQNPHIRGVVSLFEIDKKRWSAPALLQIFQQKLFLKKKGWKEEDFYLIRKWVKQMGIRWGVDWEQRKSLLKNSHCTQFQEDRGATWQQGFERLLKSLAIGENEERISFSDAPLLGELISAVRHLEAKLADLKQQKEWNVSSWVKALKQLDEEFFAWTEEREMFAHLLNRFEASVKRMSEKFLSFTHFYSFFRDFFQQETVTSHGSQLQTVCFCSLLPMRSIPSRIIFLLGLNEESFPRRDHRSSFDLLQCDPKADYVPTPLDFDRYLFLETVLSAREKLIITYPASPSHPNEASPSSAVMELLQYVSKNQIYTHPARSYDPSYFEKWLPVHRAGEKYGLINYSEADYRLAVASLKPKKEHHVIPEFHVETPSRQLPSIPEGKHCIPIEDLLRLFRHPLRFYFQKNMGIYLKDEESIHPEEEMILSPLHLGRLKKEAIRFNPSQILEKTNLEGWFPLGIFRKVANKRIAAEIAPMHLALHSFGISQTQTDTMHFIPNQKEPKQREDGSWVLPSPSFHFDTSAHCLLTGSVDGVSSLGIFLAAKESPEEIFKHWPLVLLLNTLPDGFSPVLHFVKNRKKREIRLRCLESAFQNMLSYYFLCLHHPSPLMPGWTLPILHGESALLEKQMKSDLKSLSRDPFLAWSFPASTSLPSPGQLIEAWQPVARQLFQEFSDAGI